ncbi:hypothetical protein CANTEDRAFT_113583 [Yamadazyma tenuis ATCC 10573]|uniref:Uncharacterized protein n=2 Tax=Candida tenuis TaxID=2315449 RepID=G3B0V3_CANTC|nr:uncharacterized protein CANTEDRAFT_113583 [Yamadazyma tenuis ATCC 10573]EGV64811.1 hypothetical protein CANTEDRAFT_113583 [Yamadazyma tenuis ATCC 10573]
MASDSSRDTAIASASTPATSHNDKFDITGIPVSPKPLEIDSDYLDSNLNSLAHSPTYSIFSNESEVKLDLNLIQSNELNDKMLVDYLDLGISGARKAQFEMPESGSLAGIKKIKLEPSDGFELSASRQNNEIGDYSIFDEVINFN